jgi:two-component system chemotaxis response regulator CheB
MSYSLSPSEIEAIYSLAERLTGTCQQGSFRREVLLQNVCRRITAHGASSLESYLKIAEADSDEFSQLVSALTIHTTSWFREEAHFEKTWLELVQSRSFSKANPLKVFSIACSTGKEPYSFALMFEEIRQSNPDFEYQIMAVDIDPVSVMTATRGIYSNDDLSSIPDKYHYLLRMGSGKSANFFTLSKEVLQRCKFDVGDLRDVDAIFANSKFANVGKWDLVICRNVLIYFSSTEVDKIIHAFAKHLDPKGLLCLGHSEAVEAKKFGFEPLGNAIYRVGAGEGSSEALKRRILVIDDSTVVRKVIANLFRTGGYDVLEAASADAATELLKRTMVDVISLDLHMPEKDGPTWLKEQRLKGLRVPVIILSDASPIEAVAVLGALEKGAQDYAEKRELSIDPDNILAKVNSVADQHKRLKASDYVARTSAQRVESNVRPEVIVIGASTGGTEALVTLLQNFSLQSPPILVVQHITPNFTKAFAERLAEASGLKLGSLEQPNLLKSGMIYLAQGDYHIGVRESRGGLEGFASQAAPSSRHRPSVDFLFHSASLLGVAVTGILLTGMGKDGAEGLLAMQRSGAHTMAQDEASCVVFGMPREAIARGAVQFVGNLNEIRNQLNLQLKMAPRTIKKIS